MSYTFFEEWIAAISFWSQKSADLQHTLSRIDYTADDRTKAEVEARSEENKWMVHDIPWQTRPGFVAYDRIGQLYKYLDERYRAAERDYNFALALAFVDRILVVCHKAASMERVKGNEGLASQQDELNRRAGHFVTDAP
ncbi:hypothetical protein DACRYDRAFT_109443 [Dacryopinax primogenitus]|uniref:Uncharacterized protein n=1 Tax=Dacryopinax primogenitus (strain DJM 731) TaxID=1858805 RepID=M5FWE9_DACPD|nr:uncharacterized protein DACRYDRAFT_109443 [Dacryopinax primogenitus]EJU00020.1 hypothetical protein DACRYDRAFT_109443 [Dacryopinax primogenitus]